MKKCVKDSGFLGMVYGLRVGDGSIESVEEKEKTLILLFLNVSSFFYFARSYDFHFEDFIYG